MGVACSTLISKQRIQDTISVVWDKRAVNNLPLLPKVSVIAPCRNECDFIYAFIQNIRAQDYPKHLTELIIVDGMSSDGTKQILDELSTEIPNIIVVNNIQKTVPHALNIGITSSSGDIIVRTDIHANYPKNYISTLIKKIYEYAAANVGTTLITKPANESLTAKAIAAAISSRFGVGDSHFRIGINRVIEVDTVPFGCFHRELFNSIGFFDTDLIRNQDDEFNGRIKKNGGKIILIPEPTVEYYARDSLRKLWNMYYQYGLFKPLVAAKLGRPASYRQLVPPIFLTTLIIFIALSLITNFGKYLVLFLILAYLFAAIVTSKAQLAELGIKALPLLLLCFFLIHIAYGAGYLFGAYKLFRKKKFDMPDTNR